MLKPLACNQRFTELTISCSSSTNNIERRFWSNYTNIVLVHNIYTGIVILVVISSQYGKSVKNIVRSLTVYRTTIALGVNITGRLSSVLYTMINTQTIG